MKDTSPWSKSRSCNATAGAPSSPIPKPDAAVRTCPREIGARCAAPRAATRSQSGKALLRKRGEHLERGFAHVMDQGGMRRATLRGSENLTKRYLIAALSFNLSLLLRTIFGTGTAKQWLARPLHALFALLQRLGSFPPGLLDIAQATFSCLHSFRARGRTSLRPTQPCKLISNSTGC